MEVVEAIRSRRSIRKYLDRPIEDEKLREVLDAARLAPSGVNRQEWKFVIVRDPDNRRELAAATRNQEWIAAAPVIVACAATDTKVTTGSGEPAHRIDVSIAVDHMTLRARELGLGTCWIGAFDQRKAEQILNAPESAEVIVLMTLGYPAEEGRDRGRKALEKIVSYEKF